MLRLVTWLLVCGIALAEEVPTISIPAAVQGDETTYTVLSREGKEMVRTYDSKTKKLLAAFDAKGLVDGKAEEVVLSGHGNRLFIETEKDIEAFERVGQKWEQVSVLPKPARRELFAVAPDGKTAWIGVPKRIEQWSVEKKASRLAKHDFTEERYTLVVADEKTAVVQVPNRSFALVSEFGTMTEKSLGKFEAHGKVQLSADGKTMAFLMTVNDEDFVVVVMTLATRRVQYIPIDSKLSVNRLNATFALSPNGKSYALFGGSQIVVTDVATWKSKSYKYDGRSYLMSFSKEGSTILLPDAVIPLTAEK